MFDLVPLNKHIVLDPIKDDEKVGKEGIIIAPGNALEKQYRLARIVAKHDCDEARHLTVGDTVLYDAIGAVTHRIGKQSFTTVKALNVLGIVRERALDISTGELIDAKGKVVYDPDTFEPRRGL